MKDETPKAAKVTEEPEEPDKSEVYRSKLTFYIFLCLIGLVGVILSVALWHWLGLSPLVIFLFGLLAGVSLFLAIYYLFIWWAYEAPFWF